jgi:hypothetical protein
MNLAEEQDNVIQNLKEDTVSSLCKSLTSHPSQWTWYGDGQYFIEHQASDIKLSVKHGIYVYKPCEIKFSFLQRRRLRRAFKSWKKNIGNQQEYLIQRDGCQYIINTINEEGSKYRDHY